MTNPVLIIQVPRDSRVELQLAAEPLPSLEGDDVLVEVGPTDEEGVLEALVGGQAVLAVPSPEALRRDPDEVHRVIADAGTGTEPLVVEIEAAEELREDELSIVVAAARRSPRPVILRVIRQA